MIIYKKTLKRNGRSLYIELTPEEIEVIKTADNPNGRVIIDLSSAIEEVHA